MPEILVETSTHFDYDEGEVQELIDELQRFSPESDVRRVYEPLPYQGGGPLVVEILSVWVPWEAIAAGAAGGIAEAVASKTVEWLRNRQFKRHGLNPALPLPKRVYIYGPRGDVLQVVEVEHPEAEPQNIEIDKAEEHKRNRSALREWPPR